MSFRVLVLVVLDNLSGRRTGGPVACDGEASVSLAAPMLMTGAPPPDMREPRC